MYYNNPAVCFSNYNTVIVPMCDYRCIHMELQKRETINEHCQKELQQVSGWSPWFPAMVPHPPKALTRNYKPRDSGADGYYSSMLLDEANEDNPLVGCGVYELMVETLYQRYPVYIGSTCRRRRGPTHGKCPNCDKTESHICSDTSLCERVGEYLVHGSHKRELINAVIQHKCTVYVRAKRFRSPKSDEKSRKDAQDFENSLLSKYDYAWNKREPNGSTKRLRDIPLGMVTKIVVKETVQDHMEEERKKEEDDEAV